MASEPTRRGEAPEWSDGGKSGAGFGVGNGIRRFNFVSKTVDVSKSSETATLRQRECPTGEASASATSESL